MSKFVSTQLFLRPKMRTSFGQEGKGRYDSFRSWINAWVTGKTDLVKTRAIPECFCDGVGA